MIDLDLITAEKLFVLVAVTGAWFSGYLMDLLRGKR
jgi:hypothetical protein